MKRAYTPLKLAIAGAVVAAAYAIAGPGASAQDTTTSTTTSTSTSVPRKVRNTATPQMIEEAIERSQARTRRYLSTGTPERFGSEEPYTFSTTK